MNKMHSFMYIYDSAKQRGELHPAGRDHDSSMAEGQWMASVPLTFKYCSFAQERSLPEGILKRQHTPERKAHHLPEIIPLVNPIDLLPTGCPGLKLMAKDLVGLATISQAFPRSFNMLKTYHLKSQTHVSTSLASIVRSLSVHYSNGILVLSSPTEKNSILPSSI